MIQLRNRQRSPTKQKGVALIMAMLIVVLVTAVAVEISWRFELSISRSANRWSGVQAKAYMEGAEQLAMVVLREDATNEETNVADNTNEMWAQPSQFPTDHGMLSGRIEDAQGRFNLNLVRPPPCNQPPCCPNGTTPQTGGICPPPASPCDKYTPGQLQFVRLLQTVNLAGPEDEEPIYLDTQIAEEITEAVIDYLDDDSEISGFGGAESSYYEQLDPPLTIANKEMISVSELMLVKGVTPKLYRELLPYIIALPKQGDLKINLNTAPLPVLRTWKSRNACDLLPLPEEIGQEVASVISAGEYETLDDAKQDPMFPTAWLAPDGNFDIDQTNIMIGQSKYFLLFSEVLIGEDHVRRGNSLIKRDAGGNQGELKIEVVRRTDANF